MTTPEQRVFIAQLETLRDSTTEMFLREGCNEYIKYWSLEHTTEPEDELAWLKEEGFCGTCAFFNREPRCQGGICGFYPDKPQVEIGFGCEEYETDKEYEDYWLQQEDK